MIHLCPNHPQIEAFSFCKGCGEYYCLECLNEGNEYYYCSKPECIKLLHAEQKKEVPAAVVTCPECGSILELTIEESGDDFLRCPECQTLLDIRSSPAVIAEEPNYIVLLTLMNQADVAVVKSIFDDGGIMYYTAGENFLRTDPYIQPVRFFVNEAQKKEALALIDGLEFKVVGPSLGNY